MKSLSFRCFVAQPRCLTISPSPCATFEVLTNGLFKSLLTFYGRLNGIPRHQHRTRREAVASSALPARSTLFLPSELEQLIPRPYHVTRKHPLDRGSSLLDQFTSKMGWGMSGIRAILTGAPHGCNVDIMLSLLEIVAGVLRRHCRSTRQATACSSCLRRRAQLIATASPTQQYGSGQS